MELNLILNVIKFNFIVNMIESKGQPNLGWYKNVTPEMF
jgi:hypothetical protein